MCYLSLKQKKTARLERHAKIVKNIYIQIVLNVNHVKGFTIARGIMNEKL